ncbi:glycosyltransferase family 4 protein [Pseudomonas sp. gcc21]|uniref:hypothetical protein n=1 Tax=Pseudomonas sp. gcc21 TaxID=2726989 RepID=UPI0014517E33|nr:hypothetical protein [Pseudomonas sp. gcc21]QJD58674.1 glycosyltransferase family 4 protein [Pseudomonas sp. gcc21]
MGKLLVVVPNGLSDGVVSSQVFDKFEGVEDVIFFMRKAHQDSSALDLKSIALVSTFFEFVKELRASDIVYTRSVFDYLYVYFLVRCLLMKAKITIDVRGLVAEESRTRGRGNLRYLVLDSLQTFSVRSANIVETVSENMKKHLESRYPISVSRVTPCLVSKRKVRRKIIDEGNGALDVSRFIYVGSMSEWQRFDMVCKILSNFDSEYSLTVVTRQAVKATTILERFGLQANVVGGDWEVVREELDNADFGFICRDNNLVNVTASPIKFLEYAARGVIPIMTKWVGDYSDIFHDCAVVMEDGAFVNSSDLKKVYTQETLDLIHRKVSQYVW